jgi:putative phosphonate metabolism protein
MDGYARYAIYAAPEGALWDWGSAWLGWDARLGLAREHPAVPGLPRPAADLTATPRKYGLHATIKPPFRLAEGTGANDLHWAMGALALRLAPARVAGLRLARLGGFLALVPEDDAGPIGRLAAQVVEALDPFRAPPDAAEIARRNPDRLTVRQRGHLARWGYPFVMEDFFFHITLTGDLPEAEAAAVQAALAPVIGPLLPRPLAVDSLCLFGEGAGGRFHLMHRYTLSG